VSQTEGTPEDAVKPAAEPYGIAPPAYRLPPAARPGAVRLQVADLQRSLRYYTSVLGLRVISSTPAMAVLGSDAGDEPLVELQERAGSRPVPAGGRLGLYHFAILLPDRATLGRFVQHLTEQRVRFGASDHLVSEALYLQDPDGLGIEVYADRPRSSWRHENRQLLMDTRPLNLPELATAGGDEPWKGMPAGTTIGHIHLHVGDVARAEQFYHRDLGFDKMVWSYPGALFLGAGGYHHHLGVNSWAAGAEPAGEGDARLLEWEIVVPRQEDVAAALEALSAAGATVREQSGDALVSDPWGTRLRIRAVRPGSGAS